VFFKFDFLEYAIGMVQENQMGLKLIGSYQQLVNADNWNVLEGNIDTIRETDILIGASKETG
jgi:hypothetical protein